MTVIDLTRLSVIRGAVDWAYARVADNRHRVRRLLGDDACSVHARTP